MKIFLLLLLQISINWTVSLARPIEATIPKIILHSAPRPDDEWEKLTRALIAGAVDSSNKREHNILHLWINMKKFLTKNQKQDRVTNFKEGR